MAQDLLPRPVMLLPATEFFVCDPTGSPEYGSLPTLDPEAQRRLANAYAAGVDAIWLDGRRAMLRNLSGPSRRFLVVLVHARGGSLSQRQREVAECAAAGATVEEIARHLGISQNTVRHHLKAVYRALEVGSRLELSRALGHLAA
ncbi:hypothetical protein DB32_000594 [Sandaracinus amylolyticus]|uniref:HTH luxR-type domain-containing protein n=1 Tax=Sandaracinus amylolyticus TaxID=927083 RepID=A0A0F6YFB1_9BACT|nr:hypothetical protein DB32_000594 [Sandaracinus amylolyticus]